MCACMYTYMHTYTQICVYIKYISAYIDIYIYEVSIVLCIYTHSDLGLRVAGTLGRVGRGHTVQGRLLLAEEAV